MPIILLTISVAVTPTDTTQNTDASNETVSNTQKQEFIALTGLSFNETNIEIDIKETKDILLEITPINADIDKLEFNSTNSEIAKVEKNSEKSDENKIYMKIQPITEGECEVYVNSNDIESNKIKIIVIDSERMEKEKNSEEEQEKKDTHEDVKEQTQTKSSTTTTTKNNNSSAQTTSTQQSTNSSSLQTNPAQQGSSSSSSQSTSSSTSQSNSNNSNGKIIYRTPSGKRYHFDPDCGGKNSYIVALSQATSAGLTPCQKCAQ